eukprot:867331-Amphidinium_carterae.1
MQDSVKARGLHQSVLQYGDGPETKSLEELLPDALIAEAVLVVMQGMMRCSPSLVPVRQWGDMPKDIGITKTRGLLRSNNPRGILNFWGLVELSALWVDHFKTVPVNYPIELDPSKTPYHL